MNARIDTVRWIPRLAGAAGATAITAALLMGIGLGFPNLASAQMAPRVAPGTTASKATAAPTGVSIERGRYVVSISGCNDCHTGGYGETAGRIPESDRLTGLPVGFKGPWGTSYPANLRLTVQTLNESQWLTFARAERLPPMPWFSLRDMSDDDLRSMYRYIRALGPKGTRMPAAVGPGVDARTPFILFVPQGLPAQAVTQTKPVTRDTRG
ncbi:MAG: cytochrome C [Gammaproteobacteria bacterium]